LRISYLEIYNKRISELLNKDIDLKVYDTNGQIFVRKRLQIVWRTLIMNKSNKKRDMRETAEAT